LWWWSWSSSRAYTAPGGSEDLASGVDDEKGIRGLPSEDVGVPSGHTIRISSTLVAVPSPKWASAGSCDSKLLPARSSRIWVCPPAVT